MIPINNSDLAWLIVSDYNQDNDIGCPEALRDDVNEPQVNDWRYEYRADWIGGIPEGSYVGSGAIGTRNVGCDYPFQVGSNYDSRVGIYPSHLAGGHHYNAPNQ